jgi:transketolase
MKFNEMVVQQRALEVRKKIVELSQRTRSGHVGPSLSVTDILTVLYESIVQGELSDENRDRVILSKGHACTPLYVLLNQNGWLSDARLESFASNGCSLGHHPHYEPEIGLEANTGSLGHGLPIGCGLAYSAKLMKISAKTYVVLSDGETNEGSVWEAAMFAAHHRLSHLCMILDANQMQAMGSTRDILDPIDHSQKWAAFGWDTVEIDGHDLQSLYSAFSRIGETDKPLAIIAHTIKGKGVSFMENELLWHYRTPQGEEFEAAMLELAQ